MKSSRQRRLGSRVLIVILFLQVYALDLSGLAELENRTEQDPRSTRPAGLTLRRTGDNMPTWIEPKALTQRGYLIAHVSESKNLGVENHNSGKRT
ncbi:hypothetical protein BV25DRAFT_244511 [Artomyces pyxidatus]|uniref:Uncharacterized protein n=1 Tax=Artomyces pyxidatus TaxID=48021 RepID=A0ACB8T7P5_9AGAM|nr:hypothetical protein BV25DRAFT_244511 [Artomyces pyxidatus]